MNKLLFLFSFLFSITVFTQSNSSFNYRIYNTAPCQICPTDSLTIDPKKGTNPYKFANENEPIKVDSATYFYFLKQQAKRKEKEQPNLP
jgi:hypothetical protein